MEDIGGIIPVDSKKTFDIRKVSVYIIPYNMLKYTYTYMNFELLKK